MHERPQGYVPAFGVDWLLPLYDPFLRWVIREDAFKQRLVREAQIHAGHRVLDLGCGTGTLMVLVKRLHPQAEVYGLDGDPKALAIAERKAKTARVEIALELGFSYELPYPDAFFNRVLSSLVFHHLTRVDKERSLHEVMRVLKPGGILWIVDFGEPATWWGAQVARLLQHREQTRDNVEGRLLSFLTDAGFVGVEQCGRHGTLVGSLSFYRGGKKPAQDEPVEVVGQA